MKSTVDTPIISEALYFRLVIRPLNHRQVPVVRCQSASGWMADLITGTHRAIKSLQHWGSFILDFLKTNGDLLSFSCILYWCLRTATTVANRILSGFLGWFSMAMTPAVSCLSGCRGLWHEMLLARDWVLGLWHCSSINTTIPHTARKFRHLFMRDEVS